MTTETGPLPAAGTAPATAPPAATVPQKRGFGLDPRYWAPLFITLILLGAHFSVGALESPWKTGLAIVVAMAVELLLGRVFTGKFPNLASAYITGISVGILVRSPFLWPYAACSAISIGSKYVLRVKNRHIWNPSNFGIAAMLFLAPQAVASLSIQFGNSIYPMIVIWILGSFIISRLKRFHICAAYVVSFLILAGVRAAIIGDGYNAEVAPITGPMYQLFIFFMITDPKTTVSSKKGQVVVAVLIALVESILRTVPIPNAPYLNMDAPYLALFAVGPVANLIEIYGKRGAAPKSAAPAAG
jgi:Na+-transporting NADH:ubiquinone oxidoreductase subunit NqrB